MTAVTSSAAAASSPRKLPLELLAKSSCKKGTPPRIAKLRIPNDLNVSVQWSEKGSYRHENMVAYLTRWLEPWSEWRARRGDYRILMMDLAASHLSPLLLDLAWSRGYCVLYHYGCTTAVAQVNDTHCHADFSDIFTELECASMVQQRLLDPANIGRTLQQVLDDAAATWRVLQHDRGVSGHLYDGLSNALDGSEDDWIRGDAFVFWRDTSMAEERLRAIAEVDELVQSGVIKGFDQWQQVIRHPPNPGAKVLEGEEFEGDLDPGEKVWLDEKEQAELWAEEAELMALEAEDAGEGPRAMVASDEAVAQARRLAQLKETLASLRGMGVPAAANLVNQQVVRMEKSARCVGREDQVEARVRLRGFVRKGMDAEIRAIKARQKDAARKRRIAASVRAKKKKAEKKKKMIAKEKAALKARIDKLPKTFTAATCGDEKGGLAARVLCLERLKLYSPPLDLEREVGWEGLKKEIARKEFFFKCEGLSARASIGHAFVGEVDRVVKELKEFYTGPATWNKKAKARLVGGDPDAFVKFFDKFRGFVPACATAVTL